jgi:ATP-dependent Zn protease
VDVDKLAKMTVGFSGADLENMVNTAAIRAAVDGEMEIF